MSQNNSEVPAFNFSIENLYVKDVSFEAPKTPYIFQAEWQQPKIDFDFSIDQVDLKENNLHEITLSFSVNASVDEKIAFIVEVKQAGIFQIRNFQPKETQEIIHTTCPNILFPYVREMISNLVTKGGFPNFLVPPINFDGLYMQKLQETSELNQ